MIPRLFLSLGGEKTLATKKLASKIIDFHVSRMRPSRHNVLGELQPSTITTLVRTLFGVMTDLYDWRFQFDRDFNFENGLVPQLNKREKLGPGHGATKKAELKGAVMVEDIDLAVFDLTDPSELQMAVLTVFGGYFDLRDCAEHAYLEKGNIERGMFEKGHPLEGKDFWMLQFQERKTSKLSTRNTSLGQDENAHFPVDTKPGRIIEIFLDRLSPFQRRLYCMPANAAQKLQFASSNHPKALYNHNKPIGVNTIRVMIKAACKKLGFPDASGHGFRRLFITTLANDAGVSVEESMRSAGHNSFAAQCTYMKRNGHSETNKFKALGLVAKK